MKTLTIFCLFLSSLSAQADMVITEFVEVNSRNMTMTLKIKGDNIRMDSSPQMSTITDTATGDTITISHATKSYMRISKATMEQLKAVKSQASSPTEKPKLVDTGKSEKVGNFNAEVYTSDTPTSHFRFWATKDIPNYAAVQEQLRKFRAMSTLGPAATSAPDTSQMQGMIVKTEIVSKEHTMTITVLSAEEKPIDDAEMAPPAGYTEVSMP